VNSILRKHINCLLDTTLKLGKMSKKRYDLTEREYQSNTHVKQKTD